MTSFGGDGVEEGDPVCCAGGGGGGVVGLVGEKTLDLDLGLPRGDDITGGEGPKVEIL